MEAVLGFVSFHVVIGCALLVGYFFMGPRHAERR